MKRSALIRRVALALLTAFGLLASSPTEASVSRDSSFKASPFAALPQLTSKPIAERLAAPDQNDAGCAALCELAASIDSDPLGYGTNPRPFDGRATPFGRQYAYASDNPTMYVDPSGHLSVLSREQVAALLAATETAGTVISAGAIAAATSVAAVVASVGVLGYAKVEEAKAELQMEAHREVSLRAGRSGVRMGWLRHLSARTPGEIVEELAGVPNPGVARDPDESGGVLERLIREARGAVKAGRRREALAYPHESSRLPSPEGPYDS